MTTPNTQLPPELEAIVLAVLETRVKDAKALARVPLEPLYADGEKRVIRSPLDDTKLGTVYRTDPEAKWQVTDRNALCEHLAEDPENVEYVYDVNATQEQIIEVLLAFAPELVARVERVSMKAQQAAVAAASVAGASSVPGISRVKPRGSLAVRPDKGAGEAIERLVAAKWITWDGQPLELPVGASEEPPPPVDPEPNEPEVPMPARENLPNHVCICATRLKSTDSVRMLQGQPVHAHCERLYQERQAANGVSA